MRSVLGLLVVALLALGFYYFYFSPARQGGPGAGAVQAISTTGVKNDLLAIAQAERMHLAQKGSYATFDELISSGMLRMEKPRRDNYVYTVEVTADSFTATARYQGPPGLRYPTLVIDPSMQVREVE